MSIWVRAVCTSSVGAVTPEELRAAVAERLPALAALYGEAGAAEAAARLRVEEGGRGGPAGESGFGVLLLHYREEQDRFLRIERWAERDRVAEEIAELRDELEGCEEDEVDTVLECLDAAVETVAVELKMSDTEGMGWPVAVAAAASLAARGGGLIQADNEGWMAPRGRQVEHLVDND